MSELPNQDKHNKTWMIYVIFGCAIAAYNIAQPGSCLHNTDMLYLNSIDLD